MTPTSSLEELGAFPRWGSMPGIWPQLGGLKRRGQGPSLLLLVFSSLSSFVSVAF